MILPKSAQLLARQSNSSGSCNCITGGAIAGIVIGTIAGTLFIWWLIWSLRKASSYPKEDMAVEKRHSHRGSSRRGRHSNYVDRDRHAYRVREPSKVYYRS